MAPLDQYIKINNINTRYWQAGDSGHVILLIHGFAGSVEYWMYNIEALAKNHRVYAVDMVGFGRSDKPAVDYTTELLANFVKDFITTLKLSHVNLIGHSLGGAVCLQVAINFPQLLEKLILVDSAGFGQQIPYGFRILSIPYLGKFLLKFDQKEILKRAVRMYAYNKKAITDEFISCMHEILQLPGTKKTILAMLRQHANFFIGIRKSSIKSILQNLNKISVPTLVIWGKQDKLLPVEHTEIANKHIPNVKVELIDGCGHIPQMETRDIFQQLVCDFID